MGNIGGQLVEGLHHLSRSLDRTFHDEALVQTHQLGGAGLAQQIIADGDAHRLQATLVQTPIDECRVHGDVSVVGDEQVALLGIELFKPGVGHPFGGRGNHALHEVSHFHLHIAHRAHLGPTALQCRADQGFEQPAQPTGERRETEMGDGRQQLLIGHQARQRGRNFVIMVGADLGKKIGVVLRLSHYSRLIRSGRKIGADSTPICRKH